MPTGDSVTVATTETLIPSPASEGRSPTLASPCRKQSAWDGEIHVQVAPVTPTCAPLGLSAFQFPSTPPSPPRSTFVDDLMRADLYVSVTPLISCFLPLITRTRSLMIAAFVKRPAVF